MNVNYTPSPIVRPHRGTGCRCTGKDLNFLLFCFSPPSLFWGLYVLVLRGLFSLFSCCLWSLGFVFFYLGFFVVLNFLKFLGWWLGFLLGFFYIQVNPNMWSMLTFLAPWCVKMWGASCHNSVGLGEGKPYFCTVSSLSFEVTH